MFGGIANRVHLLHESSVPPDDVMTWCCERAKHKSAFTAVSDGEKYSIMQITRRILLILSFPAVKAYICPKNTFFEA